MKARDNPFATDRHLAFRYRPLDCTWDHLLRRLAALRYRALIVGPEGSGKTTLLEDLVPPLRASGFATRLTAFNGTGPFVPAEPGQILLLDGTERLDRRGWTTLLRHTRPAAGLIATAHVAGPLPTLIECRTTLPLLRDIVAALAPQHLSRLEPLLPRLFARRSGNIRLALADLYDVMAEL